MKRSEVETAFENLRDAKGAWAQRHREFNDGVAQIMRLLMHEAAVNYMSHHDVARMSGYSVKRVRDLMRAAGLNPRDGKRLLSQKAAEALANNAALMGIEPGEMDLMSPLAYLPMGSVMKRELAESRTARVNEQPLADLLAELRREYSSPMSDADSCYWDRYNDVDDVLTRIEALTQA